MIDINLIRENRDLVKENIKKKFQDKKLPLVDEVYNMDIECRDTKTKVENIKAEKNKLTKSIGALMAQGKKDEAEEIKKQIAESTKEVEELENKVNELTESIKTKMMTIPNIISDKVPIGEDDTHNVELQKFGEPIVPKYEIPYHADIFESVSGLDKESAGRTSGEGFYYLVGGRGRRRSGRRVRPASCAAS